MNEVQKIMETIAKEYPKSFVALGCTNYPFDEPGGEGETWIATLFSFRFSRHVGMEFESYDKHRESGATPLEAVTKMRDHMIAEAKGHVSNTEKNLQEYKDEAARLEGALR